MMPPALTKDQILADIQTIYQLALENGNWHAALRAKEMQGKILGLFEKQRLPEVTRIADMTEEQLREFMERLEKHDPSLKDSSSKTKDLEKWERDLDARELKIRERESERTSSEWQPPSWQEPKQQTYGLQPSEPQPPELKPPKLKG